MTGDGLTYRGFVRVRCPHCGREKAYQGSLFRDGEITAITCNGDEGGCATLFAVKVALTPAVTVYELREREQG
jgi:hypothetical protein